MNRLSVEQMHPRLVPWPRDIPLRIRVSAFIEAWAGLVWVDCCRLLGYRVLRSVIRRTQLRDTSSVTYDAILLVRVAVRDACIFYFRPVACLQRSSVVTWMLRRRGVQVDLVIGFGTWPLEGHAWVEHQGRIVWDSLSALERFQVLERL